MELPLINHIWALIAALVVIVFGLIRWSQKIKALSRVTHALVLALILLAIGGPHTVHTSPVGSITALIDVSDSMSQALGQKLLNSLDVYRAAGVTVKIKPFSATTAAFTSDETNYQELQRKFESLGTEHSNFNQALRSAASEENVLFLSDGTATQGGAVSIQATKIYPLITAGLFGRDDLELKQLIVPLRAPKDVSLPIRLSIKNHGNVEKSGKLSVTIGKQVLSSGTVTIPAGNEKVLEFKAENIGDLEDANNSKTSAEVTVEAKLDQTDSGQDIQDQKAYVTPAARDEILLLSGTEEDQRYVKRVLQDDSFDLKTSVGSVPQEIFSQISKAKAVILNNISIEMLGGEERAREITNAVKQGVGLITIGGPKAYGLGGYRGSAIESALAVEPLPPKQQEKRLNVAVELIIDKSRSMADEERLESAKEASREVIRNLKDDDFIGIIGFDTTPFEVVRLGKVGDIRDQAIDRVGRLFPAARTNLFPSLEEGRRRLEVVEAARKHMIVLTDGKIPDADATYNNLVQGMRLLGITMSTVLVSDENDFGFLEELANIGGGTFYRSPNASNLPRIFMQDIRVRSGEQSLKEQQLYEVRRNPGERTITNIDSFPTLRGYVETAPKSDSHVELSVRDGSESKPLLAERSVGAGRSVAFMSDANGRWSNLWIEWSEFRKFWFDIVQRASRPSESKSGRLKYEVETSLQNGMQTIWITTYGGVPQKLPELSLSYENGKQQNLTMTGEAKGRYSVSFPPTDTGKLLVNPTFDGTSYPGVAIYVDPQKLKEDPKLGVNSEYLSLLAAQSGGVVNPNPSILLGNEKHETQFLARPLLIAALLLYLLSLFSRVFLARNKN